MKTRPKAKARARPPSLPDVTSEILILADGTVYAHNITPRMAGVLALLDPADVPMRARAGISDLDATHTTHPTQHNLPNSAP